MRQIVFTLLGLLMITSASAEDAEYYPLVREGVTWYYLRYQGQVNIAYVSPDYLYSFCCDGDTTVMDKNDEMKTYKKVVYREYDNLKNETFSVVLRGMREESKVVYSKDLYENIYNNMDRHCFNDYDLGLVDDTGLTKKLTLKEWAKIYLKRKNNNK